MPRSTTPTIPLPRLRFAALMMALALACLGIAVQPATGAADPTHSPLLLPPGKKIFLGVTDTGNPSGLHEFAASIGRYPPVMQTFHPWGNSLDKSMPRWREVRTRPMLHITTMLDDGTEKIRPRGIAFGGGDDYLLYLNRSFAEANMPVYIRPLGEPNRCLNPYAAIDCSGKRRSAQYASKWYRRAFQRMYLILHGGKTRAVSKHQPTHQEGG